MVQKRFHVTVQGPPGAEPLLGLLSLLGPVDWEYQPSAPGLAQALVFSTSARDVSCPDSRTALTLTLVSPFERIGPARATFRFSSDEAVPFPFVGRTHSSTTCRAAPALSTIAGERPLLSADADVVWTVRTEGRATAFRSALPLPAVTEQSSFFECFEGGRFLDALPIVHFFRLLTGETQYVAPGLRASFVIDDPNLHWPRYGFVDYAQVVSHAERGGYHVCFATIPLDTWYTHRRTADLFKRSLTRVSLLVHGNDHTNGELASRHTPQQCEALLRQSMARMSRLTRRFGVGFARVMVPPHGACNQTMLETLPRCGFESACISSGSLHGYNPGRAWTRTLGYGISEVVGRCPVLPRWGLAGPIDGTVLVAAYLGQAIIVMGHHQDLASEMETFDRVAALINSLGPVTWGDMTTLSRLNYQSKLEGGTLRVRAYGSVIRMPTDCATTELSVQPMASGGPEWRVPFPLATCSDIDAAAAPSEVLQVSPVEDAVGFAWTRETNGGPIALRSVVRRLLTETRDRCMPLRRRITLLPRGRPGGRT